MRKLLLGFAVLGVAAMFQSSANAKTVDETLLRQRVDLDIASVYWADDVVVITARNRGLNLNNQTTVARVRMYRMVNGKEVLVAGAYVSLPAVASGTIKTVSLRMPQRVTNCRLTVELDFTNRIGESNESNNRFSRKIP